MAQSILIFDFGTNEEAAQQARHKIEAWQQGFRLGKKILLKFDRAESNGETDRESEARDEAEAPSATAAAAQKGAGKSASKSKAAPKGAAASAKEDAPADAAADSTQPEGSRIRLLVRLDFSDHEKLTQQRWLDRIPSEEPFKSAKFETVRRGDEAFASTSELFDSLD